jgi:hypothetical protein
MSIYLILLVIVLFKFPEFLNWCYFSPIFFFIILLFIPFLIYGIKNFLTKKKKLYYLSIYVLTLFISISFNYTNLNKPSSLAIILNSRYLCFNYTFHNGEFSKVKIYDLKRQKFLGKTFYNKIILYYFGTGKTQYIYSKPQEFISSYPTIKIKKFLSDINLSSLLKDYNVGQIFFNITQFDFNNYPLFYVDREEKTINKIDLTNGQVDIVIKNIELEDVKYNKTEYYNYFQKNGKKFRAFPYLGILKVPDNNYGVLYDTKKDYMFYDKNKIYNKKGKILARGNFLVTPFAERYLYDQKCDYSSEYKYCLSDGTIMKLKMNQWVIKNWIFEKNDNFILLKDLTGKLLLKYFCKKTLKPILLLDNFLSDESSNVSVVQLKDKIYFLILEGYTLKIYTIKNNKSILLTKLKTLKLN